MLQVLKYWKHFSCFVSSIWDNFHSVHIFEFFTSPSLGSPTPRAVGGAGGGAGFEYSFPSPRVVDTSRQESFVFGYIFLSVCVYVCKSAWEKRVCLFLHVHKRFIDISTKLSCLAQRCYNRAKVKRFLVCSIRYGHRKILPTKSSVCRVPSESKRS